jgi:biofilm PGA synthesis N-glycosyltransferase PgaC
VAKITVMIETFLIYTIVVLGVVNSIKTAFYYILGDIYGLIRLSLEKGDPNYAPLISIIVPAYNEEVFVLRTLKSILDNKYKPVEIIVVDDGSKDKTGNIVEDYVKNNNIKNVVLVRQQNCGKARALNNGIINHAHGSLIMSLDADSILTKDAVSNAVNYFRDEKVSAIAANVRINKTDSFLGIIQYIEYLIGHRFKRAFSVINNEYIIGGVGSTFRKSTLKMVNYYDTDTITEDIDLTMKILRLGNKNNKVLFASDVVCFTESVMTFRDLYKQRLRWKYGRFQTLFKNKNLFFNLSGKYTIALTFFQLPFVIYSELTFLLDPILIGFMVYLSVKYHEPASLLGVFIFLAFYSFLIIATDEYLTVKEKILSFLYTPFTYLFVFVVSIVEYIALLKSIVDYKGIIHAKEIDRCGWEHVARAVNVDPLINTVKQVS